jgi:hypothetical protein
MQPPPPPPAYFDFYSMRSSNRRACFGFVLKFKTMWKIQFQLNSQWILRFCAIRRQKLFSGFLILVIGNVVFYVKPGISLRGSTFRHEVIRICKTTAFVCMFIRWKYIDEDKFSNGCCHKRCNWNVCLEIRYVKLGCVQTGCPALVLAPSLNTTLSNEIGHSAQERALPLEVVLSNGTVLNMFCEPFWTLGTSAGHSVWTSP